MWAVSRFLPGLAFSGAGPERWFCQSIDMLRAGKPSITWHMFGRCDGERGEGGGGEQGRMKNLKMMIMMKVKKGGMAEVGDFPGM